MFVSTQVCNLLWGLSLARQCDLLLWQQLTGQLTMMDIKVLPDACAMQLFQVRLRLKEISQTLCEGGLWVHRNSDELVHPAWGIQGNASLASL